MWAVVWRSGTILGFIQYIVDVNSNLSTNTVILVEQKLTATIQHSLHVDIKAQPWTFFPRKNLSGLFSQQQTC